MASKDQLIFEVKIVPDEAGLRNLSSRVSREVGATSNLKKQIDDTADEVKLLTKDLENLGARGSLSAEQLEEAYAELQARLDRLDGVTKKTVSAQSTLIGAQNRLAGSTGNYQKLQSNANQALFSFGDIANDAQQFSFGFGQGLRAIGNNIGFLSEQVSNLSTKAGGLRGGLKALGASLLGPGGIILGIQLAVSALTIFGDKLFSSKNNVDDLKDSVDDLNSVLDPLVSALSGEDFFGISGEDPFGISETNFRIDRTRKRISELKSVIDELSLTAEEQARLQQLLGKENQVVFSRTGEIIEITGKRTEAEEQELRTLLAQQQSQRELSDTLAEYRAELEKTEEKLSELEEQQRDNVAAQREFGRITSEEIAPNLSIQPIDIPITFSVDDKLQEALDKQEKTGIESRVQRSLAVSSVIFQTRLAEANQFEQKRLQLVRERIQTENDLIKQGVNDERAAELAYTLFYAKQEELRTEKAKQEQAKRRQNAQAVFDQILGISSRYTSALSQLNQARSDETEEQAKKRFQTQKQLSVVQAIIDGLSAAVGSYKVGARIGGPVLGAAFAAASTAATGKLIQSIKKQTFDSGSFDVDGSGESRKTGFFTTDTNQAPTLPRNPDRDQPLNIILEGEFDDEVVSVKARRGEQKRIRGTYFTE